MPLLISTKGQIPGDFVSRFRRRATQVFVEVGNTTVDDSVREVLEPNAACVAARLDNIRRLTEAGVARTVRIDPLVPRLTDTDKSFTELSRALAGAGIRDAAASYLFLRPGNINRMNARTDKWMFPEIARSIYTAQIGNFLGHGTVQVPTKSYKDERLPRLRQIAEECNIQLRFCRCKNPDVTQDLCRPRFSEAPQGPIRKTLFDSE